MATADALETAVVLPDHMQLPESDGSFVHNFLEHPQSMLLTDAIEPVLQQLHPDGRYALGQDCGIYWRLTDPPERGAKSPDWFYVPGVPPTLEGRYRRSYVLWQEVISPLLLLEFVSGGGSEERDTTPWDGKFWVYEQAIHAGYYGIYTPDPGELDMFVLTGGHFRSMAPNERGHFPIPSLGVELGIWHGRFLNHDQPWLRFFDAQGNLLLTGREVAAVERQRAESERQRAERLARRLRELGVDKDES